MLEDQERAPHVAAPRALALEGAAAVGTTPPPGAIPGRARQERIARFVAYTVLGLIAFLYFVPLFWSITTSLKSLPESVKGFDLVPDNPSLYAYRDILGNEAFPFLTFFRNSLFLAGTITLFNLFLASLGGYAFARLRFPGRELLFMLVLGTLMIPDQLRLVPVYLMLIDFPVTHTNMIGTFQGFIVINLVMAVNLFLMRQYFLTIPKDYEEAAKLDGAGYFKTYWRVMLPLAGPALAAVTILVFQGTWNEFFWALILLQEQDKFTIPLGIAAFSTEYDTRWPPLMAASVIAILPITLLYVFFQRYFIAGVAASGVKG